MKTTFNIGHFPVGTLYTVSNNPRLGEKHKGVFEVQKLVRNGYNSYCVESTTPDNQEILKGMNISCNICHVDTIVKRGDGPLVVENWHDDVTEDQLLWRIDQLVNHQTDIKKHYCISKNDVGVDRKNIRTIQFFYGKEASVDQSIDMDKVWNEFVKRFGQPKLVRTTDDWVTHYLEVTVVSKKDLKKWFHQNQNRFLTNIKKAAEAYDEMMSNMYDMGSDREYGGEDVLNDCDLESEYDFNGDDHSVRGRVFETEDSDYNIMDYCDSSWSGGDSIFASTIKSSKIDSLTPITENSKGMDKLIGDLLEDPEQTKG